MTKEFDRKNLYDFLNAVWVGYPKDVIETDDNEYLLVQNPKYTETNGRNPQLVLDVNEFTKFCLHFGESE